MKSCADHDIEPCLVCNGWTTEDYTECMIEYYYKSILDIINAGDIKELKDELLQRMRCRAYGDKHLELVLKVYYEEWWEWYQKMLVLK